MKNSHEVSNKQVLVLGGNGKTGRRIVEKLTRLGVSVRVGSRYADPAFDWEDPSTWEAAAAGMDAVYISYYPDLAVPGAVGAVSSFVEIAKKAGIRKYVLLSGRGEEEAQHAERAVINSGVDYTILRASWFNQNFNESYLAEPVAAGYVALPVGDVGEPFIDAEDIADVAVAAFTDDKHRNHLYELTGPRLLTFAQAVQQIADASGREIQFQSISSKEYQDMLREYQVPEDAIALVTYLFEEVLDGRNESVSDGVFKALGREPKDFSAFAREVFSAGVSL